MIRVDHCPFNDCRSSDIVEIKGGVQTLAVTMHNGKHYDGNETIRCFKCNSCGEPFNIFYQIKPFVGEFFRRRTFQFF